MSVLGWGYSSRAVVNFKVRGLDMVRFLNVIVFSPVVMEMYEMI